VGDHQDRVRLFWSDVVRRILMTVAPAQREEVSADRAPDVRQRTTRPWLAIDTAARLWKQECWPVARRDPANLGAHVPEYGNLRAQKAAGTVPAQFGGTCRALGSAETSAR
jgi:hypothetical protein